MAPPAEDARQLPLVSFLLRMMQDLAVVLRFVSVFVELGWGITLLVIVIYGNDLLNTTPQPFVSTPSLPQAFNLSSTSKLTFLVPSDTPTSALSNDTGTLMGAYDTNANAYCYQPEGHGSDLFYPLYHHLAMYTNDAIYPFTINTQMSFGITIATAVVMLMLLVPDVMTIALYVTPVVKRYSFLQRAEEAVHKTMFNVPRFIYATLLLVLGSCMGLLLTGERSVTVLVMEAIFTLAVGCLSALLENGVGILVNAAYSAAYANPPPGEPNEVQERALYKIATLWSTVALGVAFNCTVRILRAYNYHLAITELAALYKGAVVTTPAQIVPTFAWTLSMFEIAYHVIGHLIPVALAVNYMRDSSKATKERLKKTIDVNRHVDNFRHLITIGMLGLIAAMPIIMIRNHGAAPVCV